MGTDPLVAVHKGVVLHQPVAEPRGFLLERRIGDGVAIFLERGVQGGLQEALIADALLSAGLLHELLMEQEYLPLVQHPHLASSS